MLQKAELDDIIEKVIMKDRDEDRFNCVAITGRTRIGKSRCAYLIAKKTYPQFSFENNFMGNPKHRVAFKKLFEAPDKSTNWIDEAEKVLSKQNRFSKEQEWLHQLFSQFASHNKIVLLCAPDFFDIDSRWRNSHISHWIHIFARGKGIFLKNRDIQSSGDKWGLHSVQESEEKMRVIDQTQSRILANYEKNPCALFWFEYKDWENNEEKDYAFWKAKSQEDLKKEFERWEKMEDESKESVFLMKMRMGLGRICSYLNWKYDLPYNAVGSLAGYTGEAMRVFAHEFEFKVANNEIPKEELPEYYFPKEYRDFASNTNKIKI